MLTRDMRRFDLTGGSPPRRVSQAYLVSFFTLLTHFAFAVGCESTRACVEVSTGRLRGGLVLIDHQITAVLTGSRDCLAVRKRDDGDALWPTRWKAAVTTGW
jgi:hypothetical protein